MGNRESKTDFSGGKVVQRVIAQPPEDLLTDGGYGVARRLRVDVGQTGFFAGREFRSFIELNVASGTSLVVKITVPINVILHSALLTLDQGGLRFSSRAGGTEGGTFDTPLPVIQKNRMTDAPAYTAQVSAARGGTHAGDGTLFDVVRLVAGGGQSSSVSSLGDGDDAERGVPPGTYYFIFESIHAQASTGVFKMHWEERP